MIFLQRFRETRRAKQRKKILTWLRAHFSKDGKIQGTQLDKLITLVSSEEFLIFLEYLSLTVEEKLTILSNIDLLDERKRIEAAKLQQQTKGLLQIFDIAQYLQNLHNLKEEDKSDE